MPPTLLPVPGALGFGHGGRLYARGACWALPRVVKEPHTPGLLYTVKAACSDRLEKLQARPLSAAAVHAERHKSCKPNLLVHELVVSKFAWHAHNMRGL